MGDFELDQRLQADCHVLGEINDDMILLMDNSQVSWFIIVPKVSETELVDLPMQRQIDLLKTVNRLADFVRHYFNPDKLNIAAIGNVVSQLHVHVVGRSRTDFAWPGVVWGQGEKICYQDVEIQQILTSLREQIADFNPG